MTTAHSSYRSRELLSHFSCGHCRKWFSIGDAPPERSSYYCPWCGELGDFPLKREPDEEKEQAKGSTA